MARRRHDSPDAPEPDDQVEGTAPADLLQLWIAGRNAPRQPIEAPPEPSGDDSAEQTDTDQADNMTDDTAAQGGTESAAPTDPSTTPPPEPAATPPVSVEESAPAAAPPRMHPPAKTRPAAPAAAAAEPPASTPPAPAAPEVPEVPESAASGATWWPRTDEAETAPETPAVDEAPAAPPTPPRAAASWWPTPATPAAGDAPLEPASAAEDPEQSADQHEHDSQPEPSAADEVHDEVESEWSAQDEAAAVVPDEAGPEQPLSPQAEAADRERSWASFGAAQTAEDVLERLSSQSAWPMSTSSRPPAGVGPGAPAAPDPVAAEPVAEPVAAEPVPAEPVAAEPNAPASNEGSAASGLDVSATAHWSLDDFESYIRAQGSNELSSWMGRGRSAPTAEDSAVEEAPVEEAPVEDAPVEEPAAETSMDRADEAPVDEAPDEEPVDEAPVFADEAYADQPFADDSVADEPVQTTTEESAGPDLSGPVDETPWTESESPVSTETAAEAEPDAVSEAEPETQPSDPAPAPHDDQIDDRVDPPPAAGAAFARSNPVAEPRESPRRTILSRMMGREPEEAAPPTRFSPAFPERGTAAEAPPVSEPEVAADADAASDVAAPAEAEPAGWAEANVARDDTDATPVTPVETVPEPAPVAQDALFETTTEPEAEAWDPEATQYFDFVVDHPVEDDVTEPAAESSAVTPLAAAPVVDAPVVDEAEAEETVEPATDEDAKAESAVDVPAGAHVAEAEPLDAAAEADDDEDGDEHQEWYDDQGLRWISEDGGYTWFSDDGQGWNAEVGEPIEVPEGRRAAVTVAAPSDAEAPDATTAIPAAGATAAPLFRDEVETPDAPEAPAAEAWPAQPEQPALAEEVWPSQPGEPAEVPAATTEPTPGSWPGATAATTAVPVTAPPEAPAAPVEAAAPSKAAKRKAAAADPGEIPAFVEYKPRGAYRPLLGLLFVAAAVLAVVAIFWAVSKGSQTATGIAAGVTGFALAFWWGLLSWTPTIVSLSGSILEVARGSDGERFDLRSPKLMIDVDDDTESRNWRTTITRPNGTELVIPATAVDPDEFARIVKHYRSEAERNQHSGRRTS